MSDRADSRDTYWRSRIIRRLICRAPRADVRPASPSPADRVGRDSAGGSAQPAACQRHPRPRTAGPARPARTRRGLPAAIRQSGEGRSSCVAWQFLELCTVGAHFSSRANRSRRRGQYPAPGRRFGWTAPSPLRPRPCFRAEYQRQVIGTSVNCGNAALIMMMVTVEAGQGRSFPRIGLGCGGFANSCLK